MSTLSPWNLFRPCSSRASRLSLTLAVALGTTVAGAPIIHAQCPNYNRTVLTIDQVLQLNGNPAGVQVQRLAPGPRAEVTFVLQSSHAFKNPDSAGCSGDGVSLQSTSVNVTSFQTIFQNESTVVVSLAPQNPGVRDMSFDFKLTFHQNFYPSGTLTYKKKFCTLLIPLGDMQDNEIRFIPPTNCS